MHRPVFPILRKSDAGVIFALLVRRTNTHIEIKEIGRPSLGKAADKWRHI